jgi:positive regulator of sigma E activity
MIPNTAGILYGTIMVGALLAAESARQQNYADTVGAVAIAIALYWLVHAYTRYTERRVEHREALTVGGLVQTARQELSIIAGAVLPLVALLLCWAVGARLTTAVNVDVYICAAIIVLVEVGAAIRAELSGRELVAQISFGAFFGLMVIVLNVLLR